jgi:nucleotide-binding universal stress UspA family protein
MYVIRKILHPTDFSDRARVAFGVACSLARDHRAKVIALHVVPLPIAWGEVPPAPAPSAEDFDREWNEYLLSRDSAELGVSVERMMAEGAAEEEIVRVAGELHCDLIVLGTHGRTGLSRLLMGSTAEHVLRTAPCPVLTVRHPYPEAVPVAERETVLETEPAVAPQAEPGVGV